MNVCVNLLKPAEIRYQGAVSRDFAIRVSVGAALAFGLLMLVTAVANYRSTSQQLVNSNASWHDMKPRYERIRAMQQNLADTRALHDELKAWNASRVRWNEVLDELQQVVPPSVQLTKLAIRSEFRMIKEDPSNPEDQGHPARQFMLKIDARTPGHLADEVAVRFVRTVRDGETIQPLLESIKLQGLQRIADGGGEEAERVFGIEGITYPRKM